jgi:hypothetical protein
MRILFRVGIVLIVIGIADLLWTLLRVQQVRSHGLGVVGGGGIPLALMVLGLLLVAVALIFRER